MVSALNNTYTSLWPDVEPLVVAHQPVGYRPPCHNGWLLYHSPLRQDEHPSFSVLPDGDGPGGFKDYATGDSGSIADLARRLGIDPRGGDTSNSHQSHSATLAAFCYTRKLDQARLRATWRVTETTHRGRSALRYPTSLGVDRIKFLDATKPKYAWLAKGGRRHFYGIAQASALGGDASRRSSCLHGGRRS